LPALLLYCMHVALLLKFTLQLAIAEICWRGYL